jgi:hypothetical protein
MLHGTVAARWRIHAARNAASQPSREQDHANRLLIPATSLPSSCAPLNGPIDQARVTATRLRLRSRHAVPCGGPGGLPCDPSRRRGGLPGDPLDESFASSAWSSALSATSLAAACDAYPTARNAAIRRLYKKNFMMRPRASASFGAKIGLGGRLGESGQHTHPAGGKEQPRSAFWKSVRSAGRIRPERDSDANLAPR